jgi:hypothetical protein
VIGELVEDVGRRTSKFARSALSSKSSELDIFLRVDNSSAVFSAPILRAKTFGSSASLMSIKFRSIYEQ